MRTASTSAETFTRRPSKAFSATSRTGFAATYHAVSSKWLQSYLNEYVWRYNARSNMHRSMFESLIERAAA